MYDPPELTDTHQGIVRITKKPRAYMQDVSPYHQMRSIIFIVSCKLSQFLYILSEGSVAYLEHKTA